MASIGYRRTVASPKRVEVRTDERGRTRVYDPRDRDQAHTNQQSESWCQVAKAMGGWWHVPDGEWCFGRADDDYSTGERRPVPDDRILDGHPPVAEIEAALTRVFGPSWDRV